MEIKELNNISTPEKETSLTIGIFDGIHLGHQRVIRNLLLTSKRKNLIPVVITFNPHPEKILGKGEVRLIQTLSQRVEMLKNMGIDKIIILNFNERLAQTEPEDFIYFLAKNLKMKELFIGKDFTFGKNKRGNYSMIEKYSKIHNFQLNQVKILKINREKISSSLIRKKIEEGEIEKVKKYLGRPYSIIGNVSKGYSRGKRLGIPTANLIPENEIIPKGVFISEVKIKEKIYPSVTNIGFSPTFGGSTIGIETHLFNYENDLYSEKIEIFLIKKIRDEIKFQNEEELRFRISKDIKITKNYFKKRNF
ncbi:MAG: bifunctional riboflavin kinase/FAD synthetase [Acidobacteriota bacterium]